MNELHRTPLERRLSSCSFQCEVIPFFYSCSCLTFGLFCWCCCFSSNFLCPAPFCILSLFAEGLNPCWKVMLWELPRHFPPWPWTWPSVLPIKKIKKKTSFPGVSDSWRCSDLTSASVTSGHSLSLSSLHREKASFLHVSIDQEPFCLSRGILCTCGYTCQLTNHRQLFVCSVHVLFQDFCLFLPTFTHFTAHQLSRRWESRTRIDSSCSIISTC